MKNLLRYSYLGIIMLVSIAIIICGNDRPWEGKPDTFNLEQMEFITAGTFIMGNEWIGEDSIPEHAVMVSDFMMGKYEVTNQQVIQVFNWANEQDRFTTINESTLTLADNINQNHLLDLGAAADAGRYCPIEYSDSTFKVRVDYGDDGTGSRPDLSNYPCIEITWYGAAAFCNYLSEIDGFAPCYNLDDWSCDFSKDGYRLPTESEWEYAARYVDGMNFRPGHTYSGSATQDAVAWHEQNSGAIPNSQLLQNQGTHRVGTKAANSLGLYDMSGNVSEWCYDWYADYKTEAQTNPTGPSSGTNKTHRGGSWIDDHSTLRVSHRSNNVPSTSGATIGFRVAKAI